MTQSVCNSEEGFGGIYYQSCKINNYTIHFNNLMNSTCIC